MDESIANRFVQSQENVERSPMVILDTDIMSLLEWAGSPEAVRLHSRFQPLPPAERATTIISFEEQTRGWLSVLAQARSVHKQIEAYRRLSRQLENYCAMRVLEFDERAAIELQRLRALRLRLGTMDMKIAAIVVAHDATLVSRNVADFRRVPGLRVEDWTV